MAASRAKRNSMALVSDGTTEILLDDPLKA
jgi:hypothetical protein